MSCSADAGKCNKIRHIVKLRQLLRRWRNRAAQASRRYPANVVPAGYVAVCVGINCKRFLVRATHLNHPLFKKLLVQAEEEYGFVNSGPLILPCDESFFEELLRFLTRSRTGLRNNSSQFSDLENFQSYWNVNIRHGVDLLTESGPLLSGKFF